MKDRDLRYYGISDLKSHWGIECKPSLAPYLARALIDRKKPFVYDGEFGSKIDADAIFRTHQRDIKVKDLVGAIEAANDRLKKVSEASDG